MAYEPSFGSLTADEPSVPPGDNPPFRLAIWGDFSAGAHRGRLEASDEIAERRGWKLNYENFEERLGELEIKLRLPLAQGATCVELTFGSPDDFHPDQIVKQLDVFDDLKQLEKQLRDEPDDELVKRVLGYAKGAADPAAVEAPARGVVIPAADALSELAGLAGQPTMPEDAKELGNKTLVGKLIGPWVKPLVKQKPSGEQLADAVHQALEAGLREVLHHPDFQALEAAWRGLGWLLKQVHKGGHVQVVVLDITAEELAADLAGHDELAETGVFRWLLAQGPEGTDGLHWTAILGLFEFDLLPVPGELLGRVAQIASFFQAPFLAGVTPRVVAPGYKLDADGDAVWQEVRALPAAAALGLATPGFLLRLPFGKATKEIESFAFEEYLAEAPQRTRLWGAPALALGALLAESYLKQGWAFKPGVLSELDEMPLHVVRDSGGDEDASTTAVRFAPAVSQAVGKLGLMAWLGVRGRDAIGLSVFQSASTEQPALAGRWAKEGAAPPPRSTGKLPPNLSSVQLSAKRTQPPPPPPEEEEGDGESSGDDDLLGGLGGDDDDPLAGLGGDDESSDDPLAGLGLDDDSSSSDDDPLAGLGLDDDSSSGDDDDPLAGLGLDDDSSSSDESDDDPLAGLGLDDETSDDATSDDAAESEGSGDDDLDALLAGMDDDATDETSDEPADDDETADDEESSDDDEESSASGDDDLDALLAELGSGDEESTSDEAEDDDSGIDPELAALLGSDDEPAEGEPGEEEPAEEPEEPADEPEEEMIELSADDLVEDTPTAMKPETQRLLDSLSAPEAAETLLDFAALLAPIPGDAPGGVAVPFDVKERLTEGRKEVRVETFDADDPTRPDETKRADWPMIQRTCEEMLTRTSKDLLLAARLTEALIKLHGFTGLRDGVRLMRLLVEAAWDRLYPPIEEEDDLEVRAAPFNWLDDPVRGALFPTTVRGIPLLEDEKRTYSYLDWRAALDAGDTATSQAFERAVMGAERADCAAVVKDLEQTLEDFRSLSRELDEKMGDVAPGFASLRPALEECATLARQILERKGPEPEAETREVATAGASPGGGGRGPAAGSGRAAMSTREDAYRQLMEAAALLQRLEPHSPIPYLVQRAVELGKLPFPQLIRRLIREQTVLEELSRELGIPGEPEAEEE